MKEISCLSLVLYVLPRTCAGFHRRARTCAGGPQCAMLASASRTEEQGAPDKRRGRSVAHDVKRTQVGVRSPGHIHRCRQKPRVWPDAMPMRPPACCSAWSPMRRGALSCSAAVRCDDLSSTVTTFSQVDLYCGTLSRVTNAEYGLDQLRRPEQSCRSTPQQFPKRFPSTAHSW
jgi:hypothetical protein